MNGDPRLAGETALVTGASSGIGQRIAERLHAAGALVILVGRDRERLVAATPPGDRAIAVPADLTDTEEIAAMADRVLAQCEKVTILVNGAGTCAPRSLADVTSELLLAGWLIHVRAPVLLAQRFAPTMRDAGRGSIINMSSVLADRGHPDRVDYASAKGAIEAATRALAAELGPDGIRVNAIAPGITETPMTSRFIADEERSAAYVRSVPLGRVATVDDVADAAVFLASPASKYITGQCIRVDGGWSSVGAAIERRGR